MQSWQSGQLRTRTVPLASSSSSRGAACGSASWPAASSSMHRPPSSPGKPCAGLPPPADERAPGSSSGPAEPGPLAAAAAARSCAAAALTACSCSGDRRASSVPRVSVARSAGSSGSAGSLLARRRALTCTGQIRGTGPPPAPAHVVTCSPAALSSSRLVSARASTCRRAPHFLAQAHSRPRRAAMCQPRSRPLSTWAGNLDANRHCPLTPLPAASGPPRAPALPGRVQCRASRQAHGPHPGCASPWHAIRLWGRV